MKKVELHLHLDGSIRPSTISEILNINLEEAKKLSTIETKCASLKEYLTKFDIPLKIMQTKENLERVAFELAQDLQKDDVIYAEIRFAPNKHLKSGLTLDEVVTIKTNLILCMMRGDSYEQNLKVIKLAKKYLNHGVVAIDLAGSEASYPVNLYQELFEIAQKENIPFTIHAGEADGPLSVINAINLGAKRIGHGVRAIESEKALKLIKEKNITLEVCPKSNLDTNMYEKLSNHPIKKLYDMGLLVTINTDNRTVSNTNLTKSYQDLQEVFSFTKQDFLKMNENALQSAFLNQDEIEELLALLHK